MLEFKSVTFRYKNEEENIMENLSFSIEKGEFVSIIGASGCGKSTVFRLLNGLETPDGGSIVIENKPAYMPQKDLLFPWRTIEKNVVIGMEISKKPKKQMLEEAEAILKEVGLYEYRNKYPKDLSGGMKQRASFARTLLTGSDLLLLDEPFSALDYLTKISLQEWLLEEWEKHKKTILFVTHDVEEALFLSKKILVIKNKPITTFEEYEVPLPYPRKREDMKNIQNFKEELIKSLRENK
ncbi:MAG: ABC transporter ATP-binding protein [Anaerotignaceae bacterium]